MKASFSSYYYGEWVQLHKIKPLVCGDNSESVKTKNLKGRINNATDCMVFTDFRIFEFMESAPTAASSLAAKPPIACAPARIVRRAKRGIVLDMFLKGMLFGISFGLGLHSIHTHRN
jgi:hypothetical protein